MSLSKRERLALQVRFEGVPLAGVMVEAFVRDDAGKPRDRSNSHAGSLYRMITTFDDTGTPKALVNFTRGNDENPQSPFYNDQQPAWIDNKHSPLLFKRDEVDGWVKSGGAADRQDVDPGGKEGR